MTNGTYRPNWVAIITTVIICFGLVLLVLLVDDLRKELFVQRLTSLVFTLAAVVVLFSVVPSSAKIGVSPKLQKGGITVVGAAAFFMLVLPRITEAMFPRDVTVSGNVFYENSTEAEHGLTPV
jgi:hypothetical protein